MKELIDPVNDSLKLLQKMCRMTSVHLNMVELEADGQGGLKQTFAIFPPHQHWVAEQVGVLGHGAVELRLHHGRGAYHHCVV